MRPVQHAKPPQPRVLVGLFDPGQMNNYKTKQRSKLECKESVDLVKQKLIASRRKYKRASAYVTVVA